MHATILDPNGLKLTCLALEVLRRAQTLLPPPLMVVFFFFLLSLSVLTSQSSSQPTDFTYASFRHPNPNLILISAATILKSDTLQLTIRDQMIERPHILPDADPIQKFHRQNRRLLLHLLHILHPPEYPKLRGHAFAFVVTPDGELRSVLSSEYLDLLQSSDSFSTSFAFSIHPEYPKLGRNGFAFSVVPDGELRSSFSSQYLGLLNCFDAFSTSSIFSIHPEYPKISGHDFTFVVALDNEIRSSLPQPVTRPPQLLRRLQLLQRHLRHIVRQRRGLRV